jgi:hypothetical protein
MKPGEQKSLTTDRVILIPGPRKELAGVRAIFSMAADGNGPSAIARNLNQQGTTHAGRAWSHESVRKIVRNPKYMGCNVWNRQSQRLRADPTPVDPQFWITKPRAFSPIVNEETFERAQAGLPSPRRWSDEEILKRIRRLLKAKGRLSETLIMNARGMPSTTTIHQRFGTYRQLYDSVGYRLDTHTLFMSEQTERSTCLRQALVEELRGSFLEHIVVTQRCKRARSLLLIDNALIVSILFCRLDKKRGAPRYWQVDPFVAERDYITLVCTLNQKHDVVLDQYLFPRVDMWKSHRLRRNDPWPCSAVKLYRLADFYTAASRIWKERSKMAV